MHKFSFRNQRISRSFTALRRHRIMLSPTPRLLAIPILVLSVAVGVFYTATTNAAEVNWISTQPTATKLIDNATGSQPQQAAQTCIYEPGTSLTTNPPGSAPNLRPLDICTHETGYGSIGQDIDGNSYLRLGKYGAYSRIMYPIVHAIPQSDKLLLAFNDTYRPFRTFVTAKPITDLALGGSGESYGYYPTAYGAEIKNSVTGAPLWIHKVGISQNGRWAAMETTRGFIRYDLEKQTYFTFAEGGMYNQGSGPPMAWPSPMMAATPLLRASGMPQGCVCMTSRHA